MRTLIFSFVLSICASGAFAVTKNASVAGPKTFSSGPERAALVELYTSEGCSSCPPADVWLGKLVDHPDLWERIVPVAFHVDYWNYLGWKDEFSKSENSQRQRRYQTEGAVKSVYTPGFVVDGGEWRGWFNGRSLPKARAEDAGVLHVSIENGVLHATYDNRQNNKQTLDLQVALLGFDLKTKVAGGENRGKDMIHQFVVLEKQSTRSLHRDWKIPLPKTDRNTAKLGLAVWVTSPGKQQPLQATGAWIN